MGVMSCQMHGLSCDIINEIINLQEDSTKNTETVDADDTFPVEKIVMPWGQNEDQRKVKSVKL